jgi:hypothetical protein
MMRISCALAVAACAREAPAPAGIGTAAASPAAAVPAVPADSLRGTLRITGSEPGVVFVLVDAAGAATVLHGDRILLERLSGLEIAVRGTREPGSFRVHTLSVRAGSGVPAVDGVLARDGRRDVLVLDDGRRVPIARLPESLRGRVGARVWLTGPLDGDIDSSGIITDPR